MKKIKVPWFDPRKDWNFISLIGAPPTGIYPVVRMKDGSLGVVYQYRKNYEPEMSNLRVLEEKTVGRNFSHMPIWDSGERVVELLGILDYEED